VKDILSKRYPGLVEELQLYVDTYPPGLVAVAEDVKEDVNYWWK
jgi:hypothetical protein